MTRLVQPCGRRAQGGRQTLLVSATLTPKVPSILYSLHVVKSGRLAATAFWQALT